MIEVQKITLEKIAQNIADEVNMFAHHTWYALEQGKAFADTPKILKNGLHEWIDLNYEGWQLSLLPEGELFLEQHHARKEYQSFYPKSAEEVLIIMRATRR